MSGLRARGVCLRLARREVLRDVSATLEAGRCVALLGPTGAGKSSLLALFAGDLAPTKGRVRLEGDAPHRLGAADLAGRRAVLVQRCALDQPFSVDRVVELGFPGTPRALRRLLLAELGIEHLAERVYTELSGGEQRLVQLARVLLQAETLSPPGWLLLDEPDAQLDFIVAQRVLHAARRRAGKGLGVVAAMHDLELASRWADEVLVLSEGAVVAAGPPEQALTGALLSEVWRTPVAVDAEPGARGVRIRGLDGPLRRGAPEGAVREPQSTQSAAP